jgi:hypothetical protein
LFAKIGGLVGVAAGFLAILDAAEKRHWIPDSSTTPPAQVAFRIPSSEIARPDPKAYQQPPKPAPEAAPMPQTAPSPEPVSATTRDNLLAPSFDDQPSKPVPKVGASPSPGGCAAVEGAFSMSGAGDWHSDPGFGGFRLMSDPRAGIYFLNPQEIDPRTHAAGRLHLVADPGFQRATRDVWFAIPGSPFYFCVDNVGGPFGHFGPVPRRG